VVVNWLPGQPAQGQNGDQAKEPPEPARRRDQLDRLDSKIAALAVGWSRSDPDRNRFRVETAIMTRTVCGQSFSGH
jgi:hypothetical protein